MANYNRPFVDWDQFVHSPKSEYESWIQAGGIGSECPDPLDLFLDIPAYSSRSRYQFYDEFRTSGIDTALSNLQAGRFGDSTLWLYDVDGCTPRSYNGVLSIQEAYNALQRKRFNDPTEPDASIRRLYISNPTPESMGLLLLTSEKLGLSVVRDFLRNYIRGQKNAPSISFNIRNGGKTFSLTCHIPSFVLRTSDLRADELVGDCRTRTHGKPWRRSWKLAFLDTGVHADAQIVDIIHETQYSFTVYGHSKSIWTSTSLIDTHFYEHDPHNSDAVDFYVDDVDRVILDPRDYFFAVLSTLCNHLHEEWTNIFTILQKRILRLFEAHAATISTVTVSKKSDLEYVEKYYECLKKTEELLELIAYRLRAIIASWDDFKKDDLDYIDITWSSHQQIDNTFKEFQDILKGILDLREQCFSKIRVLDINTRSGPVQSLEYINTTFMQVITPVVVSAALVQSRIQPILKYLLFFPFLVYFIFILNCYIQPPLAPLSRWRQRTVGVSEESRSGQEAPSEGLQIVGSGLARRSRLFAKAIALLSSVGLREKDIPAGHRRIRWTNRLGRNLYDDYIEHKRGTLCALQKHINGTPQSGGSSSYSRHQASSSSSSNSSNNSTPQTPSSEYTASIELVQENKIGKIVLDGNSDDLETGKSSPRSRHLMFCVQNGRYGAKLHQLSVTDLADDRQLFRLLRDSYHKHRGRWRPYWSLKTIQSIQFMKFGYGGPRYIDVRCHYDICQQGKVCQCLPPVHLVIPHGEEYECSPVPSKLSPPIGPNLMMDYFTNPENPAPDSPLILRQIPKRMYGELPAQHVDSIDLTEAWGIYVQEDWDWGKIWAIFGLLFLAPSVLFGVLWGILKNDIQGAFGIASWWVTIGSIIFGFIGTYELQYYG